MNDRIGIGLDLGGTSIKFALGTLSGKIIKSGYRQSDSAAGKDEILMNLYHAIEEMNNYATSQNLAVEVVGIGTPGNVHLKSGLLMGSTPNFKFWSDVNIAKELNPKVKFPIFVDNDANVMALGEARYGAGQGYDNIICVTVGTGIGGGFIIDGNLYRGAAYAGGEFGHTLVEANGIPCNCGSDGCLEMYASATAMIRDFKKYANENDSLPETNELNVAYLYELYKAGNESAIKAIDDAIFYLGRGLASSINVFNPDVIIIGGGVADAGDIFINGVRKTAFKYAMDKPKENVKIIGAKLGNQAGFLGAISFAFEQLNSN